MKPLRLPTTARRPGLWFAAFAAWLITLCVLSSLSGPVHSLPSIPQSDKVAHFGWFFGGSGLLSAALFLRRPHARPLLRDLAVVAILATIGALDELRQSLTPGRDGNNLADWIANVAGAITGVLVFRRCCVILLPSTAPPRPQADPTPTPQPVRE